MEIAAAAAALEERLRVWGLREDPAYAKAVEAAVPPGTIEWRGFCPPLISNGAGPAAR